MWNGQNKDPYSNKEENQPQEPDHHDISEILIDVFLGGFGKNQLLCSQNGFYQDLDPVSFIGICSVLGDIYPRIHFENTGSDCRQPLAT